MNSSVEFDMAYKSLNNEQKKAVDAIEGPVMVVAGPGTGKTQILTLRIANILAKTDTEPENILALTFTEAAAHNMRRRLATLIGNSAYRVTINTFHGFCNDIIRRYPEDFPRIVGSSAVTDIDQVAYIEEIIENGDFVLLKPFGDRLLYVRDIISSISELKREGLTPEKFAELVDQEFAEFQNIEDLYHAKGAHKGKMKGEYIKLERKILKNQELATAYLKYQELLTEHKGYDFSDMILEVLKALVANPTLLQLLQEEFQYVLVDEHQDTNNAQNKIIELLMNYHPNPNLFVVGDEKQAIFRFQGASIENFQYFKNKYPGLEIISLSQNYRSTQSVLSAAECLLPGAICLSKNTDYEEKKISIAEFSTPMAERYFIVHDIQQKISSGVLPHEVAILYRNNSHAFPIARALDRLGIVYQIESDQDLFSQSDVVKLLTILRAIANYGDDLYVTALLHLPLFQIDPLDAYKLLKNSSDRKKYSLYDILTDRELLDEINLSETEKVMALGQKLKTWTNESRESDLLSFFEYLVRETGLLESILKTENISESFDAISGLFDQVRQLIERKPDAHLGDFFAYLETIKKHKLFIRRQSQGSALSKVRLMTVHKSKGLEFSHVYIIGAINGVFGGKIDRDRLPLIERAYKLETENNKIEPQNKPDAQSDERRLFYVALTRAKESVTITYSSEDESHKENLPSEFIAEIKDDLKEVIETGSWQERFQNDSQFQFAGLSTRPDLAGRIASKDPTIREVNEKLFVNAAFQKQGLSPTALNNYLECPWKYFYQNLLRIPSAQNKHQCYGTAVHGAIADFFNQSKREAEVSDKSYLLSAFERWTNKVAFAPLDFAEAQAKGERALSGWYDCYCDDWNLRVQTEFRINGVMLDDNIRLTGVLDKIEWNDDDTVDVVDYKTGKPKTRNDLMGKTKSGDGNYYRQLTFYKLLLKHFKEGEHRMRNGVIDFIEPDEKGRYHKECFEISDEEVVTLTELIFKVSDEIQTLSFWDKNCDDKECEFCALRKLLNE